MLKTSRENNTDGFVQMCPKLLLKYGQVTIKTSRFRFLKCSPVEVFRCVCEQQPLVHRQMGAQCFLAVRPLSDSLPGAVLGSFSPGPAAANKPIGHKPTGGSGR